MADALRARAAIRNDGDSLQHAGDLLATFDRLTEDDIAIASVRAPSFDFGALASIAGMRDSCGQVPLDFVVPRRTEVELTDGMDAAVMFFLIFLQMLALGLVEIVGQTDRKMPPA